LRGLGGVRSAASTSFSKRCCVSWSLYCSLGFCFIGAFQVSDSDPPKHHSIFPDRPDAEEISKNFQPYVIELGTLVYAWNRLHDHLAELFWCVTGIINGKIPLAIWHSTPNDRAQRDMLRAATGAKLGAAGPLLGRFEHPKAGEDIIWLLNRVDELANRRNDALHSPYWFLIGPGRMSMVATDFHGSPRAKNLKDKNLLDEFKWYRGSAATLDLFAHRLIMSLRNPEIAWPDRPELPSRGAKKSPPLRPPAPPPAGKS